MEDKALQRSEAKDGDECLLEPRLLHEVESILLCRQDIVHIPVLAGLT